jgi:hypothetical protein
MSALIRDRRVGCCVVDHGDHGPPQPPRRLVLVLLACCALLPLLAYASPPDPVGVAGIYDLADYDDVVDLIADTVAVEDSAAAPLVEVCLVSEHLPVAAVPALALSSHSPCLHRTRRRPMINGG